MRDSVGKPGRQGATHEGRIAPTRGGGDIGL